MKLSQNYCFKMEYNLFQSLLLDCKTLKQVQGDSSFGFRGDSSFGFSLVLADPYLVIPNPPCLVMLNLFQHLTTEQQTLKHLPCLGRG